METKTKNIFYLKVTCVKFSFMSSSLRELKDASVFITIFMIEFIFNDYNIICVRTECIYI